MVLYPNTSNMKPHLTAITRKQLPVPVQWLLGQNLIHGNVLDFGCGKCKPLNDLYIRSLSSVKRMDSYDPYYEPNTIKLPENHLALYDVIICTYVLCVLPVEQETEILMQLQRYLRSNGAGYISVRNDKPKNGYGLTVKKTLQRQVILPTLPIIHQARGYNIHFLTKTSVIG